MGIDGVRPRKQSRQQIWQRQHRMLRTLHEDVDAAKMALVEAAT